MRARILASGAFVATCVCTCMVWSQAQPAQPAPTPQTLPASAAAPQTQPAPPVTTAVPATPPPIAAAPASKTVQISFVTVPPTDAIVTWGKQRLGRISPISALVVVRPRDSGPLDVVVRAEGFLPVQTRAHTFVDARISVKLTRPDETATLLGYRVPIDAGVPTAPTDPAAVDPNANPSSAVNPSPGVAPTPIVSPSPNPSPSTTFNMTAPENLAH